MRFRPFLFPASVLLVLAAAFSWWKSHPPAPRSALELLPPETLFVLEICGGRDFLDKLRDTHLAALWREPEIQKMVGAQGGSWAAQTKKVVAPAVSRLRLGAAFLALLPGSAASPDWVASLEMGRTSGELHEDLQRLAGTFSPPAELGRKAGRRHGRHEVFALRWRSFSGELASSGNRCFLSTSPAALDALLDRWDRASRAATLEQLPAWRETRGRLPVAWDSRLVLQPALVAAEPWSGRFPPALHSILGGLPPLIVGQNQISERNFHDCFYLSPSPVPDWPAINPARPFSAETIFEIRLPIEALATVSPATWPHTGSLKMLQPIQEWFSASGITAAQWQEACGPEMRLAIRWPANAIRPAFLLASKIRDPAAATKLVARLEQNWQQTSSLPGFLGPLYAPALRLRAGELQVLSNAADQSLFSSLPSPGVNPAGVFDHASGGGEKAILALQFDSAQLANRGYRVIRPLLLLLSAQFLPRSQPSFRWRDLPHVDTLTRHLGLTDLQIRPAGSGVLLESNGPLTVFQWLGLAVFGPAWLLQTPAS